MAARMHTQAMSEPIAKKTTRYFINRDQAGNISYNGVDKGGPGTVIAENNRVLAVRWPAGKHWIGLGLGGAYHPASTDVLQKDDDGRFTLLISWDNRKTEKRKPALLEAAK